MALASQVIRMLMQPTARITCGWLPGWCTGGGDQVGQLRTILGHWGLFGVFERPAQKIITGLVNCYLESYSGFFASPMTAPGQNGSM